LLPFGAFAAERNDSSHAGGIEVSVGPWNKVTVIGCGLIGSSFALAMKSARACGRLAGWDTSQSVLDEALMRGIIDEVDTSFADGHVPSSDLIYLAMPVGEIIGFLREHGWQVKPGAIITDAGSTKLEVCRAAREHLLHDRRFVGGHPVAGSHLRGPAHARADLFRDAAYVLATDENDANLHALLRVKETVLLMGARVSSMTAREHDRAMALISHLPQIVASALASLISDEPDADSLTALSGAGYRDWARLSDSSWAVWRDILASNPSHIAAALDGLSLKLAAVSRELRAHALSDNVELKETRAMFK
jgi:prephenate dehydrogenase